jgi:catechol 2,3-dioxygenase-like lactoylglutathione lyase family enzyme
MNIVGLEELVFGVEDLNGCSQYLIDYGLEQIKNGSEGVRFEALDGTAVVLFPADSKQLPKTELTNCQLRKTVMGVADSETLDAIAKELSKDREVKKLDDGSLESIDDSGFVIGFYVTRRRLFTKIGEISNAPGSPIQRSANTLGVTRDQKRIQPRSLSHLVYFVPDAEKAESFYVNRLGFRCTDRFSGVGPFLQPAGSLDHHTHFLIGAPAHMQGVEHFTFHFAGPSEVMQNGSSFVEKGYQAFWGPGRHIFGSNWFWYFNSPMGCHVEMDADMDLHDRTWTPREAPLGTDASQAFLLRYRNKWAPGPGTPHDGDYA